MKYALLVYEKPGAYDELSPAQVAEISAQYYAIRDDARVVDGAHLHAATTATTVRSTNGEMVMTDGPFAETKEVFGGFYLVEADDLDSALEIAKRVPATWSGGSVEVRALAEMPA